MKQKCTKCDEIKSLTDFPKNKRKKNGYSAWCKKCKNGGVTKYRNTEKGYLKMRYDSLNSEQRKSKCYFTFDEFFAAWEKHKSTYGMRSAWGPGIDHLEQHLPMTIRQLGKGRIGKRGGRIKGAGRMASNVSPDRLDSSRDYTLQNLIFIRIEENERKRNTTYNDCKIQIKLHEERFINMEAI